MEESRGETVSPIIEARSSEDVEVRLENTDIDKPEQLSSGKKRTN